MNNKHLKTYFITLFLSLIIFGCSEEENTVNPPAGNLLFETSFEKNGYFSFDGWTLPAGSDSSTDVPAQGGKYSLLLNATWGPELYAEFKVPVLTQFIDYKLSFWSKYSLVNGKAILSLIRDGSTVKEKSVLIKDIVWSSYSISDTFSVAAGDSFLVQFTAGSNQLFPAETYFDLCKLEAFE